MLIVDLSPDTDGLTRQAVEIYLQAFPEQERLPVRDVLLVPHGGRRVVLAVDGGVVLGLMVTIASPEVVFLEYLAVDARRRSSGVGGALLRRVVVDAGDHDVLAELEPAGSSPDADRRARFYSRHGFGPAPWQGDYGMPGPDGSLVPLTLWHRADLVSPDRPRSFMHDFYTRTYGERGRPHLERILAATHP